MTTVQQWGDRELAEPALYGDTVEPDPSAVRYHDWLDLLCDLVESERAVAPRPLILFGASMGGMLAYEVAARSQAVDAAVVTCLLDTADPRARAAVRSARRGSRCTTWLSGQLDELRPYPARRL
jgi:alpha-beta hydrolase superfamily lysophospholipase